MKRSLLWLFGIVFFVCAPVLVGCNQPSAEADITLEEDTIAEPEEVQEDTHSFAPAPAPKEFFKLFTYLDPKEGVTYYNIIARKGDLYYSYSNAESDTTYDDGTPYTLYFLELLVSKGDSAWRYFFMDDADKLPSDLRKIKDMDASCYQTTTYDYHYTMTWDEAPPCGLVMNKLVLDIVTHDIKIDKDLNVIKAKVTK